MKRKERWRDILIIQLKASGTESAEILALDLEAHGEETEPPLDLDVRGFDLASAVRAGSRGLLPSQLLLFFVANEDEPHFSPAPSSVFCLLRC